MVRMTHWMGMFLLACTSTGCAQQLFDYVDNACYELKCEHRAKSAWMDARDLYGGVAYPYNFGEGFRDGYRAVCMGNDSGCAPPTPPRRYWSSCYMNCEGKAKAMAWYDGYAHGVVAASCGGCSSGCQVVTGGGGGDGVLGSALKGYKPPVTDPYLNHHRPDEYGPDGYDQNGYGPDGYGPEPTPYGQPVGPDLDLEGVPSPDGDLPGELFPEDAVPEEGGLAPQAPAVLRSREVPHLPSAEVYRVPVF